MRSTDPSANPAATVVWCVLGLTLWVALDLVDWLQARRRRSADREVRTA